MYLLEGKIKLSLAGDKERTVEGGQMEARFPIDNHNPHQAIGIALTPATIFTVKRSKLDDLMNEQAPKSHNANVDIFEENEDSLLYNQLYFEVTQEMQADKLELPSIPETAVKVRKAISDPDITSDKISKIALQDPAHL
ncbi:MAG TPA: hypothetical protein EYQ65_02160 [Cycloclasticus sp.]|jgi:hypothetical protein|nr:hypothetical protein [Cycloclasticus sp.]